MENLPPKQDENGFSMAPVVHSGGAIQAVEQSRAVAEVQAALVLARANPRDESRAYNLIMQSCKRRSLAETATYSFRRGSELVQGVSIRLAETIASKWGNIQYGFREVGRGEDFSEVEAFAHDLESNTRVVRLFVVKHWRDTKQGGKSITAERDKYELVANMAQRRVRSCLLELIPGDIVESASNACRATLESSIGDINKKIEEIVKSFATLGVSLDDLEGYLQRKIRSIVPADVVNLTRVYVSIRDGIADKSEFFKENAKSDLNKRFDKQPDSPDADIQTLEARKKIIEDFKREIDVYPHQNAVANWKKKHANRIERALPNENDYLEVMAYANDRMTFLQGRGNQGQASKVNVNL